MGNHRAQIMDAFFHKQRAIITAIARIGINHMMAAMRQSIDHRQKRAAADGMGKNDCRIGFRLGGNAHGFDSDHAERTAIDIFKARIFFKHHHIRQTLNRHIALSSLVK